MTNQEKINSLSEILSDLSKPKSFDLKTVEGFAKIDKALKLANELFNVCLKESNAAENDKLAATNKQKLELVKLIEQLQRVFAENMKKDKFMVNLLKTVRKAFENSGSNHLNIVKDESVFREEFRCDVEGTADDLKVSNLEYLKEYSKDYHDLQNYIEAKNASLVFFGLAITATILLSVLAPIGVAALAPFVIGFGVMAIFQYYNVKNADNIRNEKIKNTNLHVNNYMTLRNELESLSFKQNELCSKVCVDTSSENEVTPKMKMDNSSKYGEYDGISFLWNDDFIPEDTKSKGAHQKTDKSGFTVRPRVGSA